MTDGRNVLTRGYAISKSEPVRSVGRWVAAIVAGSVALTAATLQLLTAFGATITPEQTLAVSGFVGTVAGIIGPLVGAEVARDRATPWDEQAGALTPGPTSGQRPDGVDPSPQLGGPGELDG